MTSTHFCLSLSSGIVSISRIAITYYPLLIPFIIYTRRLSSCKTTAKEQKHKMNYTYNCVQVTVLLAKSQLEIYLISTPDKIKYS
ncbi:exported hypothetical protein [Xenorhabdus nematophila F1]|nr:exported hypothetical protein [Xenorhabdus nematophila F1]